MMCSTQGKVYGLSDVKRNYFISISKALSGHQGELYMALQILLNLLELQPGHTLNENANEHNTTWICADRPPYCKSSVFLSVNLSLACQSTSSFSHS